MALTHENISKMKELFPKTSPYYTITCDGRIMAVSNYVLTDEQIKELGIERYDAYTNSGLIGIPEDVANAVLDYIEERATELTESQEEYFDRFSDAVNHIQYQASKEWFKEYMDQNSNHSGSEKID